MVLYIVHMNFQEQFKSRRTLLVSIIIIAAVAVGWFWYYEVKIKPKDPIQIQKAIQKSIEGYVTDKPVIPTSESIALERYMKSPPPPTITTKDKTGKKVTIPKPPTAAQQKQQRDKSNFISH